MILRYLSFSYLWIRIQLGRSPATSPEDWAGESGLASLGDDCWIHTRDAQGNRWTGIFCYAWNNKILVLNFSTFITKQTEWLWNTIECWNWKNLMSELDSTIGCLREIIRESWIGCLRETVERLRLSDSNCWSWRTDGDSQTDWIGGQESSQLLVLPTPWHIPLLGGAPTPCA